MGDPRSDARKRLARLLRDFEQSQERCPKPDSIDLLIETLAPREAQAIIDHDFLGLGTAWIAQVLQVEDNTVREYLRRGRRKLGQAPALTMNRLGTRDKGGRK